MKSTSILLSIVAAVTTTFGLSNSSAYADCPGDLNNNNVVDGVDLTILTSNWGGSGSGSGDINGDGSVGGSDLALLLGAWGNCGLSGSLTTRWIATPGTRGTTPTPPSLTVNGNPFFAKGVCYSPSPWGSSAQWPPFGNFMGDIAWKAIWDRDLPVMRSGGVNLLRTYNMPYQDYAAETWVQYDHTDFLDKCWNYGVNPIYVLFGFGKNNSLDTYAAGPDGDAARQRALIAFQSTVEKYKNHPAVMGFIVANEVNNVNTIADATFWSFLNSLCLKVRQLAPDKITVMSVVDDSMNAVRLGNSQMPNLDVWGINAYRGVIDPTNANNFDNLWSSFKAQSNKPLLITEWGAPASTHDTSGALSFTQVVTNGLNTLITGHYQDIVGNAVSTTNNGGNNNPNQNNWAPVCIGSCYFQWSDELWKSDGDYPTRCQATVHNAGTAANLAFPGGWGDEECFGLNSITPVASDGVQPADRPGGPGPVGCETCQCPSLPAECPTCLGGPYNFAEFRPYTAVDLLTPRDSWTTLKYLFTH